MPADNIRQLSLHARGSQPAGSFGRTRPFTSRVISTRTLQQAGPGTDMKDYLMLQNTKSQGNGQWTMADQLTGGKNSCFELGLLWLGHGGRALARAGAGRISKGGAG